MAGRGPILWLVLLGVSIIAAPSAAEILSVDADSFADGADISTAFEGVTLSSIGNSDGLDGNVYARIPVNLSYTTTGSKVFGKSSAGMDSEGSLLSEVWHGRDSSIIPKYFWFRADFDQLVNYVAIDMVSNSDFWNTDGILWAYNSAGTRIYTDSSPTLSKYQSYTCQVGSMDSSYDIAYIVAGGYDGDNVYLDNLVVNVVPEPATLILLGLGAGVLRKRS